MLTVLLTLATVSTNYMHGCTNQSALVGRFEMKNSSYFLFESKKCGSTLPNSPVLKK